MKTIKLMAILCILSLTVMHTAARASGLRDSVKNYYQFKNKAEMAIVAGNYKEAASLYSTAFSYKKSNPRDAYNAFVVYFITGDSIDCKNCFDNLLQLGFPKAKLEWMPFIDSIKNQRVYRRFIAADSQKYYNRYLQSGKPHYSQVLDSLYTADQAYRERKGSDHIDYDSLNAAYIISLSRQTLIPSIINVGFDKHFGMRPDREGTLFLLYWHWRGEKSPLDSLMKNAVLDGSFDPADYAFQRDYSQKTMSYYQVLKGKLPDLDKNTINAINRKRAEIYLVPLEEYSQKMKFSIQNKTFAFFNQMLQVVCRQNGVTE